MTSQVSRRSILLGAAAAVAGTALPAATVRAAFAAEPAVSREKFTLAVLPDTQIATQSYPEYFKAQTQWIANNRDALNIRFTIHVGDIVEWPSRSSDWTTARSAMSTLNSRVPYVIAIGNHDIDAWSSGGWDGIAANRTCNYFNANFPPSSFTGWPSLVTTWPDGTNENSFHRFTAGGTDWGILTLKYNPTDQELSWGADTVAANPDRQFIINTHDCLDGSTRTVVGDRIWNTIGRVYANVVFILNGHYTNQGSRVDPGDHGNSVFQVMADYQDYDYADRYENSYLRTMQFDPAAGTVSVKTYSPYLNQSKTDANNEFTLTGVPFPAGAPRMRRWVTSMTSLTAWKWTSSDIWLLPGTELTRYPAGTDLGASPLLVKSSASPKVYLVDGNTKRWVPDPQVFAAWRWSFSSVQLRTSSDMAAMPTGPDVPAYPYLVKNPQTPEVYLLDAPPA